MPGRLSQDAVDALPVNTSVDIGTACFAVVPSYVTDGADNLLLTAYAAIESINDTSLSFQWYEALIVDGGDTIVQGAAVGDAWTFSENDSGTPMFGGVYPIRAVVTPPQAGQGYILCATGAAAILGDVVGYAHRFD